MKSCATCEQTYLDHVDFCFYDGSVLVMAGAGADVGGLDAPMPPRRQVEHATRAATPAPAGRRSLINKVGGAPGDPADDPLAESELSEPSTTDEILDRSAAPVPVAQSEEGAAPVPQPTANSQDPTLPPAPDREASSPAPVQRQVVAPTAPAGAAAGAAQTYHAVAEPQPQPGFAAADADANNDDSQSALLLYGALALGGACLFMALAVGAVVAVSGNPFADDGEAEVVRPELPVPPPVVRPEPAVPAAVPEAVNAPEPLPEPAPVKPAAPVPAPAAVPAPAPVPVPVPAPAAPAAPAPAPAAPVPVPAAPVPAPTPPAPAPAPAVPAPAAPAPETPAPAPVPAPAPQPEAAAPAPVPVPEPAPEPAPAASSRSGDVIITSQAIAVGSILKYNGTSYELPATILNVPSGPLEVLVEDGDGWRKVTVNVVIEPNKTKNLISLDQFLD